jgi:hypothetical protein
VFGWWVFPGNMKWWWVMIVYGRIGSKILRLHGNKILCPYWQNPAPRRSTRVPLSLHLHAVATNCWSHKHADAKMDGLENP